MKTMRMPADGKLSASEPPALAAARRGLQRVHLAIFIVALLLGGVSLLAGYQLHETGRIPQALWLTLLILTGCLLVSALLALRFSARLHRELARWQQHLSREHDSLAHQALHDPLTGLPNRTAFEFQLNRQWHDAASRQRLGVLFLDGDRFKQINDRYGHAAGDYVLATTAQRLRARLRRDDMVARLGGDEFAVLLAAEHEHQAAQVARDLVATMAQPILLPGGQRITQTLSVGVALAKNHGSAQALLAQADAAMYHVKQLGGGWYLSDSYQALSEPPRRSEAASR